MSKESEQKGEHVEKRDDVKSDKPETLTKEAQTGMDHHTDQVKALVKGLKDGSIDPKVSSNPELGFSKRPTFYDSAADTKSASTQTELRGHEAHDKHHKEGDHHPKTEAEKHAEQVKKDEAAVNDAEKACANDINDPEGAREKLKAALAKLWKDDPEEFRKFMKQEAAKSPDGQIRYEEGDPPKITVEQGLTRKEVFP